MSRLGWVMEVVEKHQFLAVVVSAFLLYFSREALSIYRRVFGDEDYRSSDWMISLLLLVFLSLASCSLIGLLLISVMT